ncbi:MAG: hypothetical protein U1C66_01580, partial [Patescibacteria group bacterium]|nr:hypothetical protein [Patescibacteria group bacterium]
MIAVKDIHSCKKIFIVSAHTIINTGYTGSSSFGRVDVKVTKIIGRPKGLVKKMVKRRKAAKKRK